MFPSFTTLFQYDKNVQEIPTSNVLRFVEANVSYTNVS